MGEERPSGAKRARSASTPSSPSSLPSWTAASAPTQQQQAPSAPPTFHASATQPSNIARKRAARAAARALSGAIGEASPMPTRTAASSPRSDQHSVSGSKRPRETDPREESATYARAARRAAVSDTGSEL